MSELDIPADVTGDVVTFRLDGEVLAVAAGRLREVLEKVRVTRVPGAPDFAAGVINVRGSVVPLADLRVPLRMPRPAEQDDVRILVLELTLAEQATTVGILADAVHEVTRLDPGTLEEIPPVGTRWPPRYVAAVGRWQGEFVTVPDLNAIFADFLGGQGRTHSNGATGAEPNAEPETV
ncbi:chemotaxis protein CheW [Allosediminivita pacifica]|uniref:Purine-binding chemotaxis protein CheW n=1 Tax=Allosediminivita pacifica TaxID=1267769 RepID=A0A2T6AW51_9RHOB|nr:chemotaxis protein CheW [Allosediminivita pacifica]PTX48051.1 purine-binding chemotaxis protein CheW [Allosediminivita pacifica]GGB11853.1 chemotaxis protein CheW [Allosediminivita pacifica]